MTSGARTHRALPGDDGLGTGGGLGGGCWLSVPQGNTGEDKVIVPLFANECMLSESDHTLSAGPAIGDVLLCGQTRLRDRRSSPSDSFSLVFLAFHRSRSSYRDAVLE
jgi:hypothetical protein